MSQRHCPRCGMQQSEWLGSERHGFSEGGTLYCCRGCAEGTGCICRVANLGQPPPKSGAANETHGLVGPRDANGRPISPGEPAEHVSQLVESGPPRPADS